MEESMNRLAVFALVFILSGSLSAQIWLENTKVDSAKFKGIKRMAIASFDSRRTLSSDIMYIPITGKRKNPSANQELALSLQFLYSKYVEELSKIGTFELVPAAEVAQNTAFKAIGNDESKKYVQYPGTRSLFKQKKLMSQICTALNVDAVMTFQLNYSRSPGEMSTCYLTTQIYDNAGNLIVDQTYFGDLNAYAAYLERKKKVDTQKQWTEAAAREQAVSDALSVEQNIKKVVDPEAAKKSADANATAIDQARQENAAAEDGVMNAPELATFADLSIFTPEEVAILAPFKDDFWYYKKDMDRFVTKAVRRITSQIPQ
jgi:hypothetical protein